MDKDTSMHHRTLGNSGAVVSTFALGTMTFGAEADEVTSHAILDDYVAAGGNFIDTADVYGSGVSEEIIGRWLAAHRTQGEQVVSPPRDASRWAAVPTTSARHGATDYPYGEAAADQRHRAIDVSD